jgi:hypothetical protein
MPIWKASPARHLAPFRKGIPRAVAIEGSHEKMLRGISRFFEDEQPSAGEDILL